MGTVNMTLKATDLTLNTTYKAGTMTRDAAGNLKNFSSRSAAPSSLFQYFV